MTGFDDTPVHIIYIYIHVYSFHLQRTRASIEGSWFWAVLGQRYTLPYANNNNLKRVVQGLLCSLKGSCSGSLFVVI